MAYIISVGVVSFLLLCITVLISIALLALFDNDLIDNVLQKIIGIELLVFIGCLIAYTVGYAVI